MSVNEDGVDSADNAENAEAKCKKIHPFFTVKNVIAPVTPDPSCSPNSVGNSTDISPTNAIPTPIVSICEFRTRKRKRRETDDEHKAPALACAACPASVPKPHKVLKLNRTTGTIGSPPRSQPSTTKTKPKRRGRKPKTFLVSIRYGQRDGDEDDSSRLRIGQQIDKVLNAQRIILNGADTPSTLPSTPPSSRDSNEQLSNGRDGRKEGTARKEASRTNQTITPKPSGTPKKPTHPFFQGKKQGAAPEEKEKPSTKSTAKGRVFFPSTSHSSKPPRPTVPNFNLPPPGTISNVLKVPGGRHPPWPSKELAHVRGNASCFPTLGEDAQFKHRERKAKWAQVQITGLESIFTHITLGLDLKQVAEELKASEGDNFQPPPAILRIADRHFESGKKLQARISGELKTLGRSGDASKTHPAIAHAYDSIENGQSAFDKATCETSTWAQKYSPSSAERVLQSGREAELLRDWLESLKVLAVDKGTGDSGSKPKVAALARGKGKRKNKLDGFIVSSDEEADELDEISDIGGDWAVSSQGNAKKTVMRSGSRRGSRDGDRLANAVVLSGPHGCGKTATVYAVAKELDFEVFEINSGSRRNGKDVLEKVGDMTRNHLVHHHHQHHQKEDAPQEGAALENDADRDLKSGKQGMMTAFFKAKPTTTQKPSKKLREVSGTKETKKPANTQKQSLILLEEVDVLYEEDKQFWATILTMISQSKRPFIMTCNDEALIPLHNLNLHGIFRLSSPPRDLAVDYLLLVAANEGHALRKHAAETLYNSRGHDLRASITELNYWCQIGVGDVQGGFNWFYPRWPRGSDVDEEGDRIRVVSQDTYRAGMGWLSRDSALCNSSFRSAQEELNQQVCQNWSLDAYDPRLNDDFSAWATAATDRCSSAWERLALLESVDAFVSAMSDADIGSAEFLAVPNMIPMDASVPNLPAKAREDFIIGQRLLEASPSIRYDTMRLDMATNLKDLSRAQLESDYQRIGGVENAFNPLDETKATAMLEAHLDESLCAESPVERSDYSFAFDPIAASEKTMAAGYLDPSVFDRTMETITLDVAPYVRSIVAYDQRLHQERLFRSSLLSEGGQPGRKRMRTTRSAYSALEGGSRASTRRERYFSADVNPHLVMRTGGKDWDAIAVRATSKQDVVSGDMGNPSGEHAEEHTEGT
ncbi:P-loop containing nucleoside triphosphate hydrolase protein [Hypoxylon crocopeplum]|nr:P-loop containing nucleoside triphosphate hydrolase protein [Hypoxylon crocopeplum]